ncbi:copper resistance protein CopC [Leucobacter sp. UT-8R-CII-1-4]|uniref:copper resistance protein CopC n=1 Tax=Leucobacter sp. UT-8R-CII-1-4 TaxID=3040075 RepID=UPI0024A81643|nr:copper resistance protein CopC [Leucobacter sp. UT-8R-CII-1-4]MDI6024110.1 copper resistance protein CopC [Leucobacter sp. UT-8R-CII-1-4]
MSTLITGKHSPRRGLALSLRTLAVLLLGGLLTLTGAQAASAHAELLSTTPENGAVLDEAPAEAVLTFNESVQLIDGSIRLFPGDEDPLTLDAHVSNTSVIAALPADLADGAYALSYRVVSADGHPISGAITFTIGDTPQAVATTPVVETATPPSTQFAVSVLTALQYLTLLIFAGLILFERLVLRSNTPPDRPSRNILRLTGIVAAAASLLLIPASALNVAGESLAAVVSPSAWWPGVFWAPVVAAIIVCVGLTGAAVLWTRQQDRRGTRLLAALLPLLALAAPVLVGHTQLMEPRALIIAADLGHLLAGSFWTGGVLGLLLFLAATRATTVREASTAPALAAKVVQKFSRLAIWSVVILAVSGTVMGVLIVGSFDALITTSYGLTLLLKIGIVIPVIAIAVYNRTRLLPRITSRPTARMQWQTLTRTLSYEAALLIAVLLLTGFLTNLSPTHEHHDTSSASTAATAQTVTIDADAQGLALRGELEPALTGENEITFTLEYDGESVAPDEVTLRTTQAEHDLGPFETTAELDPATGEYSAELNMPVAGEWELQVLARVSTFAQPIVTIPVTVN